MLQDQHYLRIPGPTPIPPSIERAMAKPMIGHRGQETSDMLARIKPGLQKIFGTKQDVLIVTGSGTSGLEAAVINAVRPGEEVIVIATGAFGERFAKICEAYHITVHCLDIEWGKAFTTEEVQEFAKQHSNAKAIFTTYCETSTGIINPIHTLAEAVKPITDALLIVDGVSCIGGIETKMDEWQLDIVVTGSQKALMLPAGLTFVAASERAWKVIEANDHKGFYLDLTKYRTNLEKNTTPFTPALSLLFGLEQAIELLEAEGYENVYLRHALMKDMTRAAFKALNIPLLTDDASASPTVTAVKPVDFDAEAFRKVLKNELGFTVAGGQQHLKGQIFRVGHMGYCSPIDALQTITAIELALVKVGKDIQLGTGVAAAQQVYIQKSEAK